MKLSYPVGELRWYGENIIPSGRVSPEERAILVDTCEKFLSAQSPSEALIIRLYWMCQLKVSEISEILRIPVSKVYYVLKSLELQEE